MQLHPTKRSKLEYVVLPASYATASSPAVEVSSAKRSRKPVAFQERTNSNPTVMHIHPSEGVGVVNDQRVSIDISGVAIEQVGNRAAAAAYLPPLRRANGNHEQRRRHRYSTAEAELVRQFRRSQTESSPRELQIRALEQATTILSSHAQDAQERAERLRALLKDRDVDPQVYETLKRERWLEENRQSVVEQERKAVRQNLQTLSNLFPCNGDSALSASPEDLQRADEIRRRRNLIRFLDTSPTHPSVRIRKATSVLFERPSKRRTLDRVSPMRLRVESTISDSSFKVQPLRPVSLDGWTRLSRHVLKSRDNATQELRHAPILAPLRVVTEDQSTPADEEMSRHISTASSSASKYTGSSTPPTTTTTSTPYTPIPQHPGSRARSDSDCSNGTATIFLTPSARSLTDMRIDAADVDAPIPDYALDLFSRFESGLPISTSDPQTPPPLPTRSSDVGPRQTQPQYDALPTRHSSSSLQVPPFTPPQQRRARMSSRIRRSSSFRQLGSLISIPESSSSSEKRAQAEEDTAPSKVSSATSLAMPTASRGAKEDLTTKIKKRFSALRIGRS